MKKILSFTMALVMVCLSAFVFVACGGDDDYTTNEPTPIPTGYKKYENSDIYFGYPSSWTETTESGVTVLMGTQNTNNVTVASEKKTNLYDDMDIAKYNEVIKPQLEEQGLTVSNVSIEKVTNKTGVKIIKIGVDVSIYGISMHQTQFILSTKKTTYCVTVTEAVSDPTLVENVFETLNFSK